MLQSTPLDEDGESLLDEEHVADANLDADAEVFVLPGEVHGTGHTGYMGDPGLDEVDVQVADVEWWPLHAADSFAAAATDVAAWEEDSDSVPDWDVDAVSDEEFGDDTAFVQFRVESADYVAHPQASAIFRDSDGDIVGGTGTELDAFAEIPPGWSLQRIRVAYGPPEGADPEHTEVYVQG